MYLRTPRFSHAAAAAVLYGVLISLLPKGTGAAKFLAPLFHPVSGTSHNMFVAAITSELVARNHTVTVIASNTYRLTRWPENAATELLKYKVLTPLSAQEELDALLTQTQHRNESFMSMVPRMLTLGADNCRDMFNDVEFMAALKSRQFDLLLGEMFIPCDVFLAEYLKVPFIAITASVRIFAFDESMYGMEAPVSYVPFSAINPLTDHMTFFQRLANMRDRYVSMPMLQFYMTRAYRQIQWDHNISPDASYQQLASKAEIWLCQTDFSLDFPRPTAPNWIPIAGIMANEDLKPLPKEFEDFVQGSGDDGVVIFSLGSMGTGLMTKERNEHLARAFSSLPQRVIWRYKGPPLRHLGKNTMISSWIPQADLLAHPKTRLLIYHGGLNGVQEAVRHKVPMVIMPLFADQESVAVRVVAKGMGIILKRDEMTDETMHAAITKVLGDPSYKAAAEHYGSIHLDRLASPMDTTMFWIEHVLKFGGAHLKSRASEMNFVVLNSLDVIAFLLTLTIVGLYIDFLLIRACWRCACGKKTRKTKGSTPVIITP